MPVAPSGAMGTSLSHSSAAASSAPRPSLKSVFRSSVATGVDVINLFFTSSLMIRPNKLEGLIGLTIFG
jgi:hypothetical protein